MGNWEDKKEVQKGDVGEIMVDNYLKEIGIIPYSSIVDKKHPFDRLCSTEDKRTLFIAEVKTKSRRTYYPDTGIDYRHYEQYKYIQTKYNIRIRLFFVDEHQKQIYGNYLDELEKEITIIHNNREIKYPLIDIKSKSPIIYFPLVYMKKIKDINDIESDMLKDLSTRNYKYE